MTPDNRKDLGKILKQRRVIIPLTLRELAAVSGVSSSHLGRIERGERFPSAPGQFVTNRATVILNGRKVDVHKTCPGDTAG